jgi:hypothetical protein
MIHVIYAAIYLLFLCEFIDFKSQAYSSSNEGSNFNRNIATIQDRNATAELILALESVAGVYKDKTKQIDLDKTVVITSCNHGYINHLHNFKCFADRLGINFLVMAMDPFIHEYLTKNTTIKSFLMENGVVGEVTTETTEFRSKQFNLITAKKKEAVHIILNLGYDVLFTDSDVAIVQDPLPFLRYPGIDYVHSLNYWCEHQDNWDFRRSRVEGNTGFYFVRSNNKTIRLWEEAYEASMRNLHLDDQAIFWTVIRQSIDPEILPLGMCGRDEYDLTVFSINQLTTCYLDTCMFSSGMLSRQYIPEMTYGKFYTDNEFVIYI